MAKLMALALVAVPALCALALLVVSFVDFRPYSGWLTRLLTDLSGREVRIDGAVRVRPGLALLVEANEVSFANPGWGSRPALATARRVVATIELRPLLHGRIEIARIRGYGLDVLLERGAAGVGNWPLGGGGSGGAAPQQPARAPEDEPFWQTRVAEIEGLDSRVAYRDAATSTEPAVARVVRLGLRSAAAGAPLQLALQAVVAGAAVGIEGRLFGPWQGGGGGLGLDGNVHLRPDNPAQMAAVLGVDSALLVSADLGARLEARARTLTLRDVVAHLGDNELGGELSLSWQGDRPRLQGRLGAPRLSLAALFPGARAPGRGDGDQAGGAAKFPWESMHRFDADLSLAVAALVLPGGDTVEDARMTAALESGALDVDVAGGGAALGRVRAELHAAAADQRVRFVAHAVDVPVDSLAGNRAARGGRLRADADLRGRGANAQAVVRSLQGDWLVEVSGGSLHGPPLGRLTGDVLLQIVDLVNPRARSRGPVRLDCAVARARVRKGVARFDKGLAVETENLRVLGAGTLDLTNGAIDLALHTLPKGGAGLSVASVVDRLVRIRGTFAEPKVEMDPAGAARAPLQLGGAVVHSGLSLVDDLLRTRLSDGVSPCLVARGAAADAPTAPGELGAATGRIGKKVGEGVGAAGRQLEKLLAR